MAIIDPSFLGILIAEAIGSFIFISGVLVAPNPFVAAAALVAAAYFAARLSGSCFNPLLVFTDYVAGTLPAVNNTPVWMLVLGMILVQLAASFMAVQTRKYIVSTDALTPSYPLST